MTIPRRTVRRLALTATMLAMPLGLAPAEAAAQQPSTVTIESFSLPNGLRVHLAPDHSSQVVAVDLWYDVGSRNERAGRTGFAHLFEHMMFQGSQHVAKMDHGSLIERAGGGYQGTTQPDRTNYYAEVPSNRLNLVLWLEADRMRSLAITPENLLNQQEAVKEERRLRFDNQPYLGTLVDSLPTMFDAASCFAYSHSIIGSMADLNAATVEDVKAFFDLYYAPNNATLVIAGDFQPAEARRLVTQYFGAIPRGQQPPPVECAPQGSTGSEVVRRVVDRNATLPAALTAYRTVGVAHADHPALELLSTILGAGESSRLNRSLVRDTKVAVAAQAMFNPFGPTRGVGIFGVLAIANQGVSVDTVQSQLLRQVSAAAEAVTEAELAKAKNAYRAGTIFSRQQAINVAEAIQYAAMYLGGPEAVNTDIMRYEAVTLADLRRVARTYLRPANSLTLQIVPEAR